MKAFKSSILLALLVSPSLIAGQVTFSGTGRVASEPDYIELSITVASECYKTPSAARVQTDLRVSKIVEMLKSKINVAAGSRDAVLTSGGYSSPFSKTVYDTNSARHTVCEGTYQKNTLVTLKTTNVANFAADFDDIQEKVLNEFQSAPSDSNDKPVTYVSIGTPQPQLFHETTAKAEKTALALALQDATAKFEATFGACAITSYRLASYTDGTEQAHAKSYAPEAAHFAGRASATPVDFDDLWTRQTLQVKFEFEGGHCTVPSHK